MLSPRAADDEMDPVDRLQHFQMMIVSAEIGVDAMLHEQRFQKSGKCRIISVCSSGIERMMTEDQLPIGRGNGKG